MNKKDLRKLIDLVEVTQNPHIDVLDRDPVLGKETKLKPTEPKQYRVLLLNDPYTDGYLVIKIIKSVFKKSDQEAIDIVMTAHRQGLALCGVYPLDVAETKVDQAKEMAAKAPALTDKGNPIQFEIEPVE